MTKKEIKDDSPRNNNDSLKELYERQNNEIIRRKIERDSVVNNGRKKNYGNLKEKANSDSVVKAKEKIVKVVNRKDKKCNSLREKIDERLVLCFEFVMLANHDKT